MRDLMFACLMLLAVPLALARPFNAYLLWGWTGMMIPTSYFYGFMADARLNLVFACITLALIILGRVKVTEYQNNMMTWMFLLFLLHCTVSFLLGYPGNPFNAQYYVLILKSLAFALLLPLFVRERMHFHAMFLIIALGLGLHGVINGLKTLLSGGGHNMLGPTGTMIGDRNHLSTGLVITLPILYYLYLYTKSKTARACVLASVGVVAMAVLGSGSRGGFLAISVVAIGLILMSKHKTKAAIVSGCVAMIFVLFAPENWTERLSTIQTADSDESFLGRVIAWRVSTAIALENPFFGGGFHAVQSLDVWEQFKASPGLLGFLDLPVPEFAPKAAHSIYFEIMGDLGIVGLLIFLVMFAQSILARNKLKRLIVAKPNNLQWAVDMADMLLLSVLAYLVGGAAVSLGYFEPIYVIVMLLQLLYLFVKRSVGQDKDDFKGLQMKEVDR